jgi:AcrR family transcriptional regulator
VFPVAPDRSGNIRRRRSSAEVRRLILTAAQDLFATKGYRGTSTREISDQAGVAEVLLFRNFGSKADLYSTAVVLPLIEFFEVWLTSNTWDWNEADTETRLREFLTQVYWIGRQHRGLIVSYLAMSVFEPDFLSGLEHSRELETLIDQLAEKSGQHQMLLGLPPRQNVRIGTRASIGMVLSMALFNDLGSGVPSEDVIEEMVQLILHGALHRPPATDKGRASRPRPGTSPRRAAAPQTTRTSPSPTVATRTAKRA